MIHSVKTGESTLGLFIKNDAFDHISQSKELNDLYNKAMTNTSKMQVAAILSVFDFGKFKHVVDIGGGTGLILSTILSKYKKIKGTLFDLPHVVDNSKDLIKDQDILNRLKIIAGTFFETIPEGGDLYMMKNILHCWDDENSVKILLNIQKVLPKEGKLLIIETIIKNDNKPSFGKMTDIYMMVGLGGRERTQKEYQILLKMAGFRIEKITSTLSPLSLIVAIPDWGG
jgi:ubiquinone/menaquinone biosynthesis C-methylase UbiE